MFMALTMAVCHFSLMFLLALPYYEDKPVAFDKPRPPLDSKKLSYSASTHILSSNKAEKMILLRNITWIKADET